MIPQVRVARSWYPWDDQGTSLRTLTHVARSRLPCSARATCPCCYAPTGHVPLLSCAHLSARRGQCALGPHRTRWFLLPPSAPGEHAPTCCKECGGDPVRVLLLARHTAFICIRAHSPAPTLILLASVLPKCSPILPYNRPCSLIPSMPLHAPSLPQAPSLHSSLTDVVFYSCSPLAFLLSPSPHFSRLKACIRFLFIHVSVKSSKDRSRPAAPSLPRTRPRFCGPWVHWPMGPSIKSVHGSAWSIGPRSVHPTGPPSTYGSEEGPGVLPWCFTPPLIHAITRAYTPSHTHTQCCRGCLDYSVCWMMLR